MVINTIFYYYKHLSPHQDNQSINLTGSKLVLKPASPIPAGYFTVKRHMPLIVFEGHQRPANSLLVVKTLNYNHHPKPRVSFRQKW
jgi:hypothetical protein